MQTHDQVLIAIRRIIRAIDLYSRHLAQCSGLTGPQLLVMRMVMRTIAQSDQPTSGEVARGVSLSQATVTTILDRLAGRGYVRRRKGDADKRTVLSASRRKGMLRSLTPPHRSRRASLSSSTGFRTGSST